MAKPRPKAAKGYQHAEEFKPGEIIRSISTKKEFKLNSVIGTGGFGLIYTAKLLDSKSSSDEYAVKIEPQSNGPLFNESHVLQRIARPEIIADYMKMKTKSKTPTRAPGIPQLIGNGIHESKDVKYRFVVLPLFDVDLQKIFEGNHNRLEERTAYCIALRMLDILEYLDFHGYVHADLKAANILIRRGVKSTDEPSIFLIDYGLAAKYMLGDRHKEYKPIKKNAHNGTLQYTSIDAHDGAEPSRRGDLQILGFCLWEWLAGSLPWKSCMKNKDDVKNKKIKCLKDLSEVPTATLKKYFSSISDLEYDENPDYDELKGIFLNYLKKNGGEKLYIPVSGATPKRKLKPMKTIENVTAEEEPVPIKRQKRTGSAAAVKRKTKK